MTQAASVTDIKPSVAPAPKPTGLALLRERFPDNLVSLLPKQMKKDDNDKGTCNSAKYSADGIYCGGYHARSIHLHYVGHAALTDRLLDADPGWTWEPLSTDERGLPLVDAKDGLLWIRLTVCGVTRLGVGDAGGKTGGNAMKERIGDALRNAAMRFGAALEFWHKGELHLDEDEKDERLGDAGAQRDTQGGAARAVDVPKRPAYPDEKFETNLPSWRSVIEGPKKKDPEAVIKQVESGGYALTDLQKARVRGQA